MVRHVRIVKRAAKPVAHRLHRKAKPLHRRKHAVRQAPVAPARCEILHRDRLFGGPELGSDAAPLVPAGLALDSQVPGAGDGSSPTVAGFFPTGGGGDSGGPVGVGGGGGPGGGESGPGGGGVISPAPEPQTWMLMMSGVLIAGLSLRRRRRRASGSQGAPAKHLA